MISLSEHLNESMNSGIESKLRKLNGTIINKDGDEFIRVIFIGSKKDALNYTLPQVPFDKAAKMEISKSLTRYDIMETVCIYYIRDKYDKITTHIGNESEMDKLLKSIK